MDIDTNKLRELLDKRDKIDEEILAVASGKEPKPKRCSKCNEEGHTARWCPKKEEASITKPSF